MVFGLDFDQISYNLVENAFTTQQLAGLATSIAFYDILTRACTEIKIFEMAFRFVNFFFAFPFSPFPFFSLQ